MNDSGPTRATIRGGSTSARHDDMQTELGTSADGAPAPATVRAALEAGSVVGRYVIVAKLGAGAMGVVHAAYDPELDRKVALKLMPVEAGDDERRREAMVLAKVNHPNVVTVHDVGTAAGWTWIAMELVDGHTLRERIAGGPVPWAELVSIMSDAARGLAAAHAVGLVHRDVKPDNIMIGGDGRVRVTDFGLAREHTGTAPARGARAGSPAYMAPEQHAGQPTDPRTDVFGWSVTFFEALYGARPFGGESSGELTGAIATGRRREAPAGIAAPKWLRETIVRGLEPDPARRWQSLDDAVARLHRGTVGGRRRKLLVVGAGLTALAATPSLLEERSDRAAVRACEDAARAIDEVWNDEARASIRASLSTVAAGGRPSAAEQTAAWFDAAARDWTSVYQSACEAAIELERKPEAIYACLDERRLSMATAVALLSQRAPGPFGYTPSFLVDALEVRGCAALAGLAVPARAGADASPELAGEVRLQMMRAAAWTELGDIDRGLADAKAAHAQAIGLGASPLVAESAARVGWVVERSREPAETLQWLERAALGGLAEPDSELVIRLALAVARAQAERKGDVEAADLWLGVARGRLERLGLRDTLLDAMVASFEGSVDRAARRYDAAVAADERALALRIAWLGEDHPLVAVSWNNLAGSHGGSYADERALDAALRAYDIRRRVFGRGHPEVMTSALNVAALQSRLGEHDLAIEMLDDELAHAIPTLGHDHPIIGAAWHNRATASYRDEDYLGALAPSVMALDIRRAALGPDHPDIAGTLANLAAGQFRFAQCAEATDSAERSLDAKRRSPAPYPDDIAIAESMLALIDWTCRRTPAAVDLAEHAATLVPSDALTTLDTVYSRLGIILSEVDPIRGNALVQWIADRAPPGETRSNLEEWQSPDFRR